MIKGWPLNAADSKNMLRAGAHDMLRCTAVGSPPLFKAQISQASVLAARGRQDEPPSLVQSVAELDLAITAGGVRTAPAKEGARGSG